MNLQRNILILILTFISQSILAQSDWTIEQLTSSDAVESSSRVEVGEDGVVHIVYEQRTYFGKRNQSYEDNIYYNTKTDDMWGIPINLGQGVRPSIDIDGNVAHIVFDGPNVTYWNSTDQNSIIIDIAPLQFAYEADLVVTSDGTVHVVFSATPNCCGGNLYYTSGNGIEFSDIVNIETAGDFDPDHFSHFADIFKDESGNLGIVCRTVSYNGGTPGAETISVRHISKFSENFNSPIILVDGGSADAINVRSSFIKDGTLYLLYELSNEIYNCCSPPARYDLYMLHVESSSGNLIGDPILIAQQTIGYNASAFDYQPGDGIEPDKIQIAYANYYNAGSIKKERWEKEIRTLIINSNTGEHLFPSEKIHDGDYPSLATSSEGITNVSFTFNRDAYFASNVNVLPQPPVGEMHVSALNLSTEVKGVRWNAVADVYIEDSESQTVSGALVTGVWSGLVHSTNTATTNSGGIAVLKSGNTKESGTITFTVTDVAKVGWTYDISANFADPPSRSVTNPFGKRIVINDKSTVPNNYALHDNYPNPFNPTTIIQYSIPEASYVELKVYDLLGKEISVLVNEFQEPGYYNIEFDASALSNDVYFYILKADDFIESKKMILLK